MSTPYKKSIFIVIFAYFLTTACSVRNERPEKTALEVTVSSNLPLQEKAEEAPLKSEMDLYMEEQGLVDIHLQDSSIMIDLKYSTTDNFTHQKLYESLDKAYLHPMAAEKLLKAQHLLKQQYPNLSLLVYDAARPLSIQKKMYETVKGTPYHAYVANPALTGLHNYGIAIDLTLCRLDGTPLDMGTKFDYFGKAAGINQEDELRRQGIITSDQIENRRLLRQVMTEAGFLTIRGEWWHFNACTLAEAKRKAKLIK